MQTRNQRTDDVVPKPPAGDALPLEVRYLPEEDDVRRLRTRMEHANQALDDLDHVHALMPTADEVPDAVSDDHKPCNNNDHSVPHPASYALQENLMPQHAIAAGTTTAASTSTNKRRRTNAPQTAHSQSLRDRIRALAMDTTLTPAARDRERQRLFAAGHAQTRARERAAYHALCNRRKHTRTVSQHFARRGGGRLPGCAHYARGCKLRAPCCGMWAVCRRCHDAPCVTAHHAIDRFAVRRILCMRCGTEQRVGARCGNAACGVRFAAYFCAKCNFWDDTPGKDIYHCDKCGLCRVGKGLGHDNYHCDKCNACVSLERDGQGRIAHVCQETSLDADCPICGTHMLTSTTQVVFMQCGHAMHLTCFDKYTATNYVCPMCSKALTDMSPHYRQIDDAVAAQQLPDEFRLRKVEIRCHDCDVRSVTNFHFIYLKCVKCNGYNTRLIADRPNDEEVRVLDRQPNEDNKNKRESSNG